MPIWHLLANRENLRLDSRDTDGMRNSASHPSFPISSRNRLLDTKYLSYPNVAATAGVTSAPANRDVVIQHMLAHDGSGGAGLNSSTDKNAW